MNEMSFQQPQEYKLSLAAAILINVNIMVGVGLFINATLLSKTAEALSPLVYFIVGLAILPAILTFAKLLAVHKGGTFYDFCSTLHPTIGFIAGMTYFTGKLSAMALKIHVFTSFIQLAIPALAAIPALLIDLTIVLLFTFLNAQDIKTGRSVQFGFLMLKLIPVLFAIISGFILFNASHFTENLVPFFRVAGSIPFALYAFAGAEACCSLSSKIENPEKNGPRAILISYAIGVFVTVLFQLMFYGALGPLLGGLESYTYAYPALLKKLFTNGEHIRRIVSTLLAVGIACSSIGSAYGGMYSNIWNLYQLAERKVIPAAGAFQWLNKNRMPVLVVIAEGVIVVAYLLLTGGNQIPLQQISAFGITLTYTLSMLAFIRYMRKQKTYSIIPFLALGSCSLLAISLIRNLIQYNPYAIIVFSSYIAILTLISAIWYGVPTNPPTAQSIET